MAEAKRLGDYYAHTGATFSELNGSVIRFFDPSNTTYLTDNTKKQEYGALDFVELNYGLPVYKIVGDPKHSNYTQAVKALTPTKFCAVTSVQYQSGSVEQKDLTTNCHTSKFLKGVATPGTINLELIDKLAEAPAQQMLMHKQITQEPLLIQIYKAKSLVLLTVAVSVASYADNARINDYTTASVSLQLLEQPNILLGRELGA